MVATNKVVRCALDELPNLGALQMLKVIVVCSTQIGAHGAVVSSNNNSTAPSLLFLVDAVFDTKTSLLNGIVKDGGVLVVTNASEVDD